MSRVAAQVGLGSRGRGEQEDRLGAVAGADAAQPADDLRDMGAEDPPVAVAFVDDDIAQRPQEGGPAGVGRQDAAMQHVGVGQDVVGVLADPLALLDGGVTVVDRGPDGGAQRGGQLAYGAPLVGRQCLGGGQVQGRGPRPFGASEPSRSVERTGARYARDLPEAVPVATTTDSPRSACSDVRAWWAQGRSIPAERMASITSGRIRSGQSAWLPMRGGKCSV